MDCRLTHHLREDGDRHAALSDEPRGHKSSPQVARFGVEHMRDYNGTRMLQQNESQWNIKGPTSAEIAAAIRYLDPDASDERLRGSNKIVLVLCAGLIFLLSCAAFGCLYYRIS